MSWLVYLDALDVWTGQGPVEGRAQVKAHLGAWLEQYECSAAASAAVATPDSNKVRRRPLPGLALPCLALPCLALPCLALPCLALPGLGLVGAVAALAAPAAERVLPGSAPAERPPGPGPTGPAGVPAVRDAAAAPAQQRQQHRARRPPAGVQQLGLAHARSGLQERRGAGAGGALHRGGPAVCTVARLLRPLCNVVGAPWSESVH
jgi:hypothetical protein